MAGTRVFAEIIDGDVYKYYFDGEWRFSSSVKSFPIINPTTRKTQYKVQACTQEEVNKVIESAKAAHKSWAKTPLWKRAELLHRASAILKEHKTPIAECLVKEIAKPAKDVVTEVRRFGVIMDTRLEGQYPKKAAMEVASLSLNCLNASQKASLSMAEALVELEQLRDYNNMAKYSV